MAHLRLVSTVPTVARPTLIPRLGLHDSSLLEQFEGFGTPVVARTLSQAAAAPELGAAARERHGLALLLDCDTWKNELEPAKRGKQFLQTLLSARSRLDLRRRQFTADEEQAYVRAGLTEQARFRATWFTTPYHVGGGPDCPVRRLDLRLARRAAQQFRTLRLAEPPPSERHPITRRLLATIAIAPYELRDPLARAMLVSQYRDLDVDGYLIKFIQFSEASAHADVVAATDFALSLQLESGRDVAVFGVKNLGLALIAGGISSVVLGIGEGETFNVSAGGAFGASRPVYYSPLLRSLPGGSRKDGPNFRTEIVFAREGCDCGHHPSDRPPVSEHERKLHTLSSRLREFTAVAGDAGSCKAFVARVRDADAVAARLGLAPSPRTHLEVGAVAERVRRRHAKQQLTS